MVQSSRLAARISQQSCHDPNQFIGFIDDRVMLLRQEGTLSQNPQTKLRLLEFPQHNSSLSFFVSGARTVVCFLIVCPG